MNPEGIRESGGDDVTEGVWLGGQGGRRRIKILFSRLFSPHFHFILFSSSSENVRDLLGFKGDNVSVM